MKGNSLKLRVPYLGWDILAWLGHLNLGYLA